VYLRDGGVCHACGRTIAKADYECGHIIDRCAGGPDDATNLVVMCVMCNRLKPVHASRGAYLSWVHAWRIGLDGPAAIVARHLAEVRARRSLVLVMGGRQ
jgi:hypothetical protein